MDDRKNILIVDDEEDIRHILDAFLDKEGYTSFSAASGREALEIVEKQNIDLIILDIMMPEMDGFEVLDHLRQNKKTENIPVIMLTGVENKEKLKEALNKGVTYYINKPFETVELSSKIRIALSGEVI